jgi:hypothetical protein
MPTASKRSESVRAVSTVGREAVGAASAFAPPWGAFSGGCLDNSANAAALTPPSGWVISSAGTGAATAGMLTTGASAKAPIAAATATPRPNRSNRAARVEIMGWDTTNPSERVAACSS